MATALELKEQRVQIWERMKVIRDAAVERDLTAEEETNWEKANIDIAALDKRIDIVEREQRTPAPQGNEGPGRFISPGSIGLDTEEYREAVTSWLRWGEGAPQEFLQVLRMQVRTRAGAQLSEAELRALSTVSATAGGFTVVPDQRFSGQLEEALLFFGGMRQTASQITTDTGADLPYPTSDDTTNSGTIVAENAAFGTQDVTFALITFKAYKYSSNIVLVPVELLQDSSIDISAFLARKLGERVGRAQNTHFTIGTGASQPTGVLQKTTQGKAGNTGSVTSVTWDELIDLEMSIGPAYRSMPGVGYMFHNNTLTALRKLKDGEGRYLWQPGGNVTGAPPATINGYSYTINNDVPAMAASANTIVFGDLSRYLIRDVRTVQLFRFGEHYMVNGQVGFLAWARADGHLLDAGTNPVKHYTNAAS